MPIIGYMTPGEENYPYKVQAENIVPQLEAGKASLTEGDR